MKIPLQSEGMQEAFHEIHAHEHSKGDIDEQEPSNDDLQSTSSYNSTTNSLLEEHLG